MTLLHIAPVAAYVAVFWLLVLRPRLGGIALFALFCCWAVSEAERGQWLRATVAALEGAVLGGFSMYVGLLQRRRQSPAS